MMQETEDGPPKKKGGAKGSWILRKLRGKPSQVQTPDAAGAGTAGVQPASFLSPAATSKIKSKTKRGGPSSSAISPAQTQPSPSLSEKGTSAALGGFRSSTAADGLADTLRLPTTSEDGSKAPRLGELPTVGSIFSAEDIGGSALATGAASTMSSTPAPTSAPERTPAIVYAISSSQDPSSPLSTGARGNNSNYLLDRSTRADQDSFKGGATSSLITGTAQGENEVGLTSTTGTLMSGGSADFRGSSEGETAHAAGTVDASNGGAEPTAVLRSQSGNMPSGDQVEKPAGQGGNGDEETSWSAAGDSDADDDFSSGRGAHRRDSTDAGTMDTGKSRASTKPTTLMSLDGPGGAGGTHAHIAQAQSPSRYDAESAMTGNNSAVHFAAPSTSSGGHGYGQASQSQGHRYSQGGHGHSHSHGMIRSEARPSSSNGGHTADDHVSLSSSSAPAAPFVNVPGYSRPHPANNPAPSGFPADNASMLTLASSNAAHSMTGAPSHRSFVGVGFGGGAGSGRPPSLGGAKSIVSSLMGDRRNSSDTHASMKALPPLSRRGSDESTRTSGGGTGAGGAGGVGTDRDSLLAQGHTSQAAPSIGSVAHSASAPSPTAAPFVVAPGGPGAPFDRISMHRTPSQRTVATQLSIPLSTHAAAGGSGGADASAASASAPAPAPAAVSTSA